MDISTYQELRKELQEEIKQVINRVTKRLSTELAKQIDKDVYKSHDPNSVYYRGTGSPTGQFSDPDVWPWTDATSKGIRTVVAEMTYNWNALVFTGGDDWLHGSNPEKVKRQGGNASKYLAEILNQDTKLSSLWITVDRPANARFWKNFIENIFDNDVIGRYIEEELKRSGFVFIRE